MNPNRSIRNILFVTSECYPLAKVGGLADVSSSLPRALAAKGLNVITLLPAYPGAQAQLENTRTLGSIDGPLLEPGLSLIEGTVKQTGQRVWLLQAPELYDRDGTPYADAHGHDWPDNWQRYAQLCRVACKIASGHVADWQPDLVHCNDWQTGLIPVLLKQASSAPPTLFTIHNLAYLGLFDGDIFGQLQLPPSLWSFNALEFYGQFSYLKGGLGFADALTTVSPTYAKEIQTEAYGCGLDGLLRYRKKALTGILNGVDYETWSPETDSAIAFPYTSQSLTEKTKNKQYLQKQTGLASNPSEPLIGLISRLVEQKGIDLVIELIKAYADEPVQWTILGNGNADYERELKALADAHPSTISFMPGYDEQLAHQIEAGADFFLMPSRYEPCGLNQMYSLRYGTVPIVTPTGGLADTIVHTTPGTLDKKQATGFVTKGADLPSLKQTFKQALNIYKDKPAWLKLRRTGMQQDFSWEKSAAAYLQLYEKTLNAMTT